MNLEDKKTWKCKRHVMQYNPIKKDIREGFFVSSLL